MFPYNQLLEPKIDGSTIDNLDMQQAIRASLQDGETGTGSFGQSDDKASDVPAHKRVKSSSSLKEVNWTTVMENVEKRIALELPTLQVPDGDTYIYIDPPPQEPEQDLSTYQWIRDRYRRPLCMKKDTLLALNSPFFDNAFGSTTQFRLMRRRGLVNRLPRQIKYILDLTPPNEGIEAVILFTELSCSEGVRNWVQASTRWNVSTQLVGGVESYRSSSEDLWLGEQKEKTDADPSCSSNLDSRDIGESAASQDSIKPELATPYDPTTPTITQKAVKRKAVDEDKEEVQIPLEYTAIRHRLAIERVLLAIAGLDPKLDSAPKVWTTFAVAKYFEIRHISLTDYIVRWLRAAPNTCFLEVLPETSLKIADGLQNWDLCRDTFALLVGEEALAVACRSQRFILDPHSSVHGRKKDEVPESYQTRIEYASKVFRERITSDFEYLVNSEMSWVESLGELVKLSSYVNQSRDASKVQAYNDATNELKQMLKTFLQGAIYRLLCSEYDVMPGPFSDRDGGDILFPKTPFRQTWSRLPYEARILTRSFWHALGGIRVQETATSFVVRSKYAYQPSDTPNRAGDLFMAHRLGNTFRIMKRRELEKQVTKCSQLYIRKPSSLSSEQNDINIVNAATTNLHISDGHLSVKNQTLKDTPISLPIRKKVDWWEKEDDGLTIKSPQVKEKPREARLPSISAALKKLEQQLPGEVTGSHSEPYSAIRDAQATTTYQDTPTDLPFREFLVNPPWKQSHSHITGPAVVGSGKANNIDLYSPPSAYSQPFVLDDDCNILPSFFDLSRFLSQAEKYLADFSQGMLQPPRVNQQDPFELNLTNTLVCLSDSEWKYLPLWAGGNDDESGGVFNDDVPIAETGFSTAGPSVHTGSSIGSSRASSEFEMVGSEGSGSTYHTSIAVHDGYSDDIDRRRVYEADSVWDDVMASRGKGVTDSSHKAGREDVSMDGDSSWDEIMTPGPSISGDDESVVHIDKGKGKMVMDNINGSVMQTDQGQSKVVLANTEESFDDVFTAEDDEDDFNDDDDDDDENADQDSNFSFNEYHERMEISENGEYIAYKEDAHDQDACRP